MGKRDSLQKVLLRAQQRDLSGMESRSKHGRTVFAFLIVGKERAEDIAAAESCRRWRI